MLSVKNIVFCFFNNKKKEPKTNSFEHTQGVSSLRQNE